MRVYELMVELAKLPAGAEVQIWTSVYDQSMNEIAHNKGTFLRGDIDMDPDGEVVTISAECIDLTESHIRNAAEAMGLTISDDAPAGTQGHDKQGGKIL